MSRSDTRQLVVPGKTAAPEAKPEIADSESIMEREAAPVDLQSDKPATTPPVQASQCIKCNASLSTIEAKMGRCLTCGQAVVADSSAAGNSEDTNAGGPSFEVRI